MNVRGQCAAILQRGPSLVLHAAYQGWLWKCAGYAWREDRPQRASPPRILGVQTQRQWAVYAILYTSGLLYMCCARWPAGNVIGFGGCEIRA